MPQPVKLLEKDLNLEGYNTPQEEAEALPSPILGRHSENMTEGCFASSQEADHAAGVQGANFCPELPDRGREEQTEATEVKPSAPGQVGGEGALCEDGL